MKRLFIVVLALLALAAAGALAEGRNALMGLEGPSGPISFDYGFAWGDQFCAAAQDALYICGPGEAELTACPYPEEEDYPSDRYDVIRYPFADGEELYALRLYDDRERGEFADATISRAAIEDGAVVFSDPRRVDLDELVDYYSDNATLNVFSMTCSGGRLFLNCASMGRGMSFGFIDLETLRVSVSDAVTDLMGFAPYRDGKLLITRFENAGGGFDLTLGVYDPSRDEVEPLCSFSEQGLYSLDGLAYDAGNDVIYGVNRGEICPLDPQTGAFGAAVNSMPINPESGRGACVLPDDTYAYAGTGAVLRSLSGGDVAATRLVIQDSSWTQILDAVNLRFLSGNPDVSVAISREFIDGQSLIESLMNQDDSIDIYVMPTTSSAYEAIYNRGYMLELDDCPNVLALADAMYPALRDSVTQNGHIVAVPVYVSSTCLGVNAEVLSRLGLTMDDVPDTWTGLVSFLEDLEQIWPEDADYSLMASNPSETMARNQLSLYLLMDYQTHFNASEMPVAFRDPALADLLDRLDRLDYRALGCTADEDAQDYRYGADMPALLYFMQPCAMGEWFTEYQPVLLSIDENSPHYLELRNTVAFVNPFTRNPEAARAFLDELAAALPEDVTYNLIPSLNEPVRSGTYASDRAKLEEKLDSLNRQLEDAEAVNKQSINDEIESARNALDELDEKGWMISQAQLDWFRAHDEGICPAKVEWLFDSDGGEALDLFFQYCQHQIRLDEMLSAVDQKIRMKAMEGN